LLQLKGIQPAEENRVLLFELRQHGWIIRGELPEHLEVGELLFGARGKG
jgi:hypothetical protein